MRLHLPLELFKEDDQGLTESLQQSPKQRRRSLCGGCGCSCSASLLFWLQNLLLWLKTPPPRTSLHVRNAAPAPSQTQIHTADRAPSPSPPLLPLTLSPSLFLPSVFFPPPPTSVAAPLLPLGSTYLQIKAPVLC